MGMTRGVTILAVAFVSVVLASCGPTLGPELKRKKDVAGLPAAAMVNGEPVLMADYEREVNKIVKRAMKLPADRLHRIKKNILKRLIERALVAQEIDDAKVVVSTRDVDTSFLAYKKRFRTEEQFQNYLKHGKVTVTSIRERIADKLALERLLEGRGELHVGHAEVAAFYRKNERFYYQKEGVQASHILVKVATNAPAERVAAARAKIALARAALDGGEDFQAVAKRMSEGPSGPKGGSLGFFGRGQMVKPFETLAFSLEPGAIGECRTRFGLHIVLVEARRQARAKPLAEVTETISESLRNKKFFQARRALLTELRGRAAITILVDQGDRPSPR